MDSCMEQPPPFNLDGEHPVGAFLEREIVVLASTAAERAKGVCWQATVLSKTVMGYRVKGIPPTSKENRS